MVIIFPSSQLTPKNTFALLYYLNIIQYEQSGSTWLPQAQIMPDLMVRSRFYLTENVLNKLNISVLWYMKKLITYSIVWLMRRCLQHIFMQQTLAEPFTNGRHWTCNLVWNSGTPLCITTLIRHEHNVQSSHALPCNPQETSTTAMVHCAQCWVPSLDMDQQWLQIHGVNQGNFARTN